MDRLSLKEENGRLRITFDPIFRVDKVTLDCFFDHAKSNRKRAFQATDKLISKYMKKNPSVLDQAQELMRKEEKAGKLIKSKCDTQEYEDLLSHPHHFSFLNIVFNEDSESSPTRIVVDSSHKIAGLQATVSTLTESLDHSVGNMYHTVVAFCLFAFTFSADIKKCYHQINIKGDLPKLTLIAWYEDLKR